MHTLVVFLVVAMLVAPSDATAAKSQCFGSVSQGRIEGSVKLPAGGPNYTAYSSLAISAGRTHVHSMVAEVIVAAYAALADTAPGAMFVYGETGLAAGGRFRPHRTHQNGLSVDFFVPVRNQEGISVALPAGVNHRLGYDIEFDSNAKFAEYTIDFPALAEHLYQLHVAAKARNTDIALVIFDPAFMPKLFATPRGAYLQQKLSFMKGKPWVRHDEHYHVDFALACKPIAK